MLRTPFPQVRKKTVIVGILIVVFILISSTVFLYPKSEKEDENNINEIIEQPVGLAQSLKNFTLDKNFSISSNIPGNYNSYSVMMHNYNNTTANETIKRIFGNVTDINTTFSNYETNGYDYWVTDGIYGIRPDNMIFYFYHGSQTFYLEKDIDTNQSLYNLTECKKLANTYISKRIGQNLSHFELIRTGSSEIISSIGKYIKSYKFSYSKTIMNLSVYKDVAGAMEISISPDGTILGFMLYHPKLKVSTNVTPINASTAIQLVDDNFNQYSSHLMVGYSDHTLMKIEPAYGMSGDTITIGWKLSFYSGNDVTKISSVFVS